MILPAFAGDAAGLGAGVAAGVGVAAPGVESGSVTVGAGAFSVVVPVALLDAAVAEFWSALIGCAVAKTAQPITTSSQRVTLVKGGNFMKRLGWGKLRRG
jgi:hypothetical protein